MSELIVSSQFVEAEHKKVQCLPRKLLSTLILSSKEDCTRLKLLLFMVCGKFTFPMKAVPTRFERVDKIVQSV